MTRVLVMDDEPSSREVVRLALHRMGIADIGFASDGAAGLKVLDRMEPGPDVILCDIFMPERDGLEIVSALVQRKFAGGLILMSSGDSQFLHIAKTIATKSGLQLLAALRKPLSDEVLLRAFDARAGCAGTP